MFVGREKELKQLQKALGQNKKDIILIYGKRRVGKTTLIKKASESFDGRIIFFEGIKAKSSVNLKRLALAIATAYSEPEFRFSSYKQAFDYLNSKKERKLIMIDEYPDLKAFEDSQTVDSMFREICDGLDENTKLVFAGSHVKMMKSLLEEDNPLFGRFTLSIKLEEFNYLEASLLYDKTADPRKKVEFYSVFGGLPYLCSLVDTTQTIRTNIEELLIPQNGQARLYIENVLSQELSSISYGETILSLIGNTKMRFSEIESRIGGNTNGGLARQLKYLLDMEIIRKVSPINKPDDKKKTYYEISNNLVRFYYTYLAPFAGRNNLLSEQAYYDDFIEKSILQFTSYRFEDIVNQYFTIQSRTGKRKGILNIGRYWYDNRKNHKNGEFDCVLETESGHEVYEIKFLSSPLTQQQCEEEAEKINQIPDIKPSKIGFVSISGFSFESDEYMLVLGNKLYC